jgi:mannitol/fructose-specific phosphotransferase system IIA component (Ntr-type)
MKLSDVLAPEAVEPQLKGADGPAVLAELAALLAARTEGKLAARIIGERMVEREREAPTALGHGTAVPHAKSTEVDRPLCAFGRHASGIPFGAGDGEPCRLFFAVLAPASQPNVHLKIMARIARLVSREEARQRILAAGDRQAVFEAIKSEDERP